MLKKPPPECPPIRVLFVCTHNSARSILAEALLRHLGGTRFEAHSAGSSPRDNQQPNPLGLAALQAVGVSTEGLGSKSWDRFSGPGAPALHAVITVCDSAASEACPLFLPAARSSPIARAHWGYADPSAGDAPDAEKRVAFAQTLAKIERRIQALVSASNADLMPEHLGATLSHLANIE